jgi:excisionase family DNA binding protein
VSVDAKPKEVADHLGLHVETVRTLTREGAFPNAYKTGRGAHSSPVRIPWKDVEDFRKKQPRASR